MACTLLADDGLAAPLGWRWLSLLAAAAVGCCFSSMLHMEAPEASGLQHRLARVGRLEARELQGLPCGGSMRTSAPCPQAAAADVSPPAFLNQNHPFALQADIKANYYKLR